jgi:AraC-like DNA-binding protein
VEHVVERVLITMRQRLGEQLTLDDLAEAAMFSKFYFARMFRRTTGLSPRRFLYALRLQEAKRMLVTTSLGVADISNRVGYNSVGTFTTRFTASVGVPPAVYRRLRGNMASVLDAEPIDPAARGLITGRVEEPAGSPAGGLTWISLFRGPVPEGRPARCDILARPGRWKFQHVPEGRWYVFGMALPLPTPTPLAAQDGTDQAEPHDSIMERHPAMLGTSGPVQLGADAPSAEVTIRLRPMRAIDPPILAGLAGPPF